LGGIEYGVEALEKCVAINEVETFTTERTDVGDNEVDVSAATTNISIEGTRPNLAVRSEGIGALCSKYDK
jgi:hypothetical protein